MSCHSGTCRVGHRWSAGTFHAACDMLIPCKAPPCGPFVYSRPPRNFDGSSTGQAPGHDSEVLLNPVYMVPDPFRERPNIIVLCECLTPSGETIPTNTRRKAASLFDMDKAANPWFGLEQEYTMFALDGRTPLGWPVNGFPRPQGPYYWYVRALITQRMFATPPWHSMLASSPCLQRRWR